MHVNSKMEDNEVKATRLLAEADALVQTPQVIFDEISVCDFSRNWWRIFLVNCMKFISTFIYITASSFSL